MTAVSDQIARLEAAIAAQDALRPPLGTPWSTPPSKPCGRASTSSVPRTLATAADHPRSPRPSSSFVVASRPTSPTRLGSSAPPATREAERRNVTVLFADLSGFTALSERFDPELIREFQDDLFDELT